MTRKIPPKKLMIPVMPPSIMNENKTFHSTWIYRQLWETSPLSRSRREKNRNVLDGPETRNLSRVAVRCSVHSFIAWKVIKSRNLLSYQSSTSNLVETEHLPKLALLNRTWIAFPKTAMLSLRLTSPFRFWRCRLSLFECCVLLRRSYPTKNLSLDWWKSISRRWYYRKWRWKGSGVVNCAISLSFLLSTSSFVKKWQEGEEREEEITSVCVSRWSGYWTEKYTLLTDLIHPIARDGIPFGLTVTVNSRAIFRFPPPSRKSSCSRCFCKCLTHMVREVGALSLKEVLLAAECGGRLQNSAHGLGSKSWRIGHGGG